MCLESLILCLEGGGLDFALGGLILRLEGSSCACRLVFVLGSDFVVDLMVEKIHALRAIFTLCMICSWSPDFLFELILQALVF